MTATILSANLPPSAFSAEPLPPRAGVLPRLVDALTESCLRAAQRRPEVRTLAGADRDRDAGVPLDMAAPPP